MEPEACDLIIRCAMCQWTDELVATGLEEQPYLCWHCFVLRLDKLEEAVASGHEEMPE